jgi:hypothetical protein
MSKDHEKLWMPSAERCEMLWLDNIQGVIHQSSGRSDSHESWQTKPEGTQIKTSNLFRKQVRGISGAKCGSRFVDADF